jgi:hypothetical protein
VAAFLAFTLAAVHSRGVASARLTAAILVLFWAVMLSGTVGYWGRPLAYRFLRLATRAEYGRARIRTMERGRIGRRVARVWRERWRLTENDFLNWPELCKQLANSESVLNKIWKSALSIKGHADAKRLVAGMNRGDRLPVDQLNPIIGLLNQWLVKTNSGVKFEDFKPRVGTSGPDHDRHDGLYRRAERLTKIGKQLERLDTILLTLKKQAGDLSKVREKRDAALKGIDARSETAPKDTASECDKELKDIGAAFDTSLKEILAGFEDLLGSAGGGKELHEACGGLRAELAALSPDEPALQVSLTRLQARLKELLDDYRGRRNRLYLEIATPHVAESGVDVEQVLPSPLEAFYKEFVLRLVSGTDGRGPAVPVRPWGWVFTSEAWESVPANRVAAVRVLLDPRDARLLDRWLGYLDRSRQLDVEEWFDRLANSWLQVHIAAASLLFVLVFDHVFGSVLFGGY